MPPWPPSITNQGPVPQHVAATPFTDLPTIEQLVCNRCECRTLERWLRRTKFCAVSGAEIAVSGAKLDDAHQDSHQERHQSSGYRRIELITGEASRRPWSAEEKAGILAESFRLGRRLPTLRGGMA